jgi:hypothetical protein
MDQSSSRRELASCAFVFHFAQAIQIAMMLKQAGDRIAERAKLGKVIASPNHRSYAPKRGHSLVGKNKLIGMDLELVICDRTGAFSSQVEVRVHRQAEGCRSIANSIGLD